MESSQYKHKIENLILFLFKEGWSQSYIMRQFNVSRGSVQGVLNRNGLKPNKTGIRTRFPIYTKEMRSAAAKKGHANK